jgi:hypothetical protein
LCEDARVYRFTALVGQDQWNIGFGVLPFLNFVFHMMLAICESEK